jgi:hypothetical protein
MFDIKSVIAKFSPEARARRTEIHERVRALGIESLDLSISELRRLSREGEDYPDELAVVELLRQRLEFLDFADVMNCGATMLLSDSTKSIAKEKYSADVQARRKAIVEQVHTLGLENLSLSVRELRRLALESIGQESRDYGVAASMLWMMGQQMQAEGPHSSEVKGMAGMVLDLMKSAANDEVNKRSQNN